MQRECSRPHNSFKHILSLYDLSQFYSRHRLKYYNHHYHIITILTSIITITLSCVDIDGNKFNGLQRVVFASQRHPGQTIPITMFPDLPVLSSIVRRPVLSAVGIIVVLITVIYHSHDIAKHTG